MITLSFWSGFFWGIVFLHWTELHYEKENPHVIRD